MVAAAALPRGSIFWIAPDTDAPFSEPRIEADPTAETVSGTKLLIRSICLRLGWAAGDPWSAAFRGRNASK